MHSRWSPPNRVGAASLAMLILTLCGCATHAQSGAGVKTDIQDLQNRIYELQKRNAEAQVEIQDLRDKEARGGASGPSSPVSLSGGGQVTSEEALVPGSTEDLGEGGPSRSMEPA